VINVAIFSFNCKEKHDGKGLDYPPGFLYIFYWHTKGFDTGGLMFGSRLPKNRKFHYECRYYDPLKEKKGKHRIEFKRSRSRSQAKMRSLIWLVFLLSAVLYFIIYLSRIGKG